MPVFYITALGGEEVQAFANAARGHWGVENRLNWLLDVTFREGGSRIRCANAPANFNTLRQFALNLLQRAQLAVSIKQTKFNAALDDDFRANLVFQQ